MPKIKVKVTFSQPLITFQFEALVVSLSDRGVFVYNTIINRELRHLAVKGFIPAKYGDKAHVPSNVSYRVV